MQYIKLTFLNISQETSDILVALLADTGYEGFEEVRGNLLAFIPAPQFSREQLDTIANDYNISYEMETVPAQNWNALWESNFQPVVVDDFCTIRAHFHDIRVNTPYEIVVTPKMSFGTGHHATTQLMISMMRELHFSGASVLDFGTGTGVLAILAEMLGASHVAAIDNDEWSVENARENLARNNCSRIKVAEGSLEHAGGQYDIILANINRHILLQYMESLFKHIKPNGLLLMSGLLTTDQDVISQAAGNAGFRFKQMQERNNWIALLFEK